MLNIHSDLVQKEMAAIGPNAFCVLLAISSHISPLKRDCFPSRARIKKMTGLGDEAVRNAIKKLSELGLLKMEQGRVAGAFEKTTYTVTTPHIGVYSPIGQIEVTDSPGGGEPHPVDRIGGEPHPVDPLLSISKERSIDKEKSLESTSEEVGDQSPSITIKAKEKAKRNGAVSFTPAREDFAAFANPDMAMEIWAEWESYKKEQHRFTYKSVESRRLGIEKLASFSDGSIQKARAIIHDAMANGYKGFFQYEERMAMSARVPDQKIPEDNHQLTEEMQKRYDAATKWFYEKCHLCAGIRWLSKAEYEKIQNKDSDFIGAMWYAHCVSTEFGKKVQESLLALNQLPRWDKEKWQSVYEWLKKDVSDRIFPRQK
jgi:Helix-turn-helix domain